MFREMNLTAIPLAEFEITCAQWLNNCRNNLAAKSVGRRMTSCRILAECYGLKILENYRPPVAAPPRPHPLPGGSQDLARLISVCLCMEHEVLIGLTGLCGMRIAEALSIGPDNFNLREKIVTVYGKGRRYREIPISPRAWNIFVPALVNAGHLKQTKLINCADRSARDTITRLGQRAGISRPIASHDLRATFATEAYRRSGDIVSVQRLMGHASVIQTQVYVGIHMATMREVADFMEDDD